MDIDFTALKEPIGADDPCGPDLDMQDDDEFLMFESDMEAKLPARFDDFFALKAENPDLDGETRRCLDLLGRSRDLRLAVWLTKLVALSGDLPRFAEATSLVRFYLTEHWESINPKPLDGDLEARMNALQRLDERASVELPLQYMVIVRDVAGNLRFRDQLVASEEVTARESERLRDAGQIAATLNKAAVENLVAGRDGVGAVRGDFQAIRALWLDKVGYDNVIKFEQVPPLLERMFTFLDEAVAARAPELAAGSEAASEGDEAGEGETAEGGADGGGAATLVTIAATGAVKSHVDAKAALDAAAHYFERDEPSSPARLLVKQAQDLVGLSFTEVLQQLAPDLLPSAMVKLRGAGAFTLSMEALGSKLERGGGESQAAPSQAFEASDRASAATLLQEVILWYRAAEPSSPIPVLLERARDLMTKDFSALLTELIVKAE